MVAALGSGRGLGCSLEGALVCALLRVDAPVRVFFQWEGRDLLVPWDRFLLSCVCVCVYFGEEWNLFLGKLSLFLSSSVALSRCGHGCVENARGVSFIRQS